MRGKEMTKTKHMVGFLCKHLKYHLKKKSLFNWLKFSCFVHQTGKTKPSNILMMM